MNPGYPKQGRPDVGPVPLDADLSKISDDAVDSSGCYVVFTSLEARRNVTGDGWRMDGGWRVGKQRVFW